MTEYEKSQLPHATARNIFTIKRWLYTLTNDSARCWCWQLLRLFLLWLVSEACQTSTSAYIYAFFKWLHLPLTSRQPAVIHHLTGCWVWPRIKLLCKCVICRSENGTNGCHLAVSSVDIAFALYFMATYSTHLPSSHLSGVLVVLATPVKKNLKWQAIQLAINSNSYRIMANFTQASVFLPKLQYFK